MEALSPWLRKLLRDPHIREAVRRAATAAEGELIKVRTKEGKVLTLRRCDPV